MALKGHLQHFGLGELFQTLACNRHSGTLYVSSRHEKKTIYFATGSIAFLATGSGSIRLGEVLRRAGLVTDEQIEAAMREQENSDKLFGRILIEQGIIDPDQLQTALRTKFEEELYELLMWEEGDFEFVPDFCPPDLLEPMQKYTQVRVDPQTVIIEGLRQLDESRIIRSRLPDPRIWVARRVEELPPGAQVEEIERKIWDRCTEPMAVSAIQSVSPATRFKTLRVLYRFVEEGWLRTLTFAEMLEIARRLRKHNELDSAAEHYRFLRDWGIAESREAAFLEEFGRFLIELGKKKEAVTTLTTAFEQLRADGRAAEAWQIGRLLRDLSPNDLSILQQLWTLRAAASPRALEDLRKELLTALRRNGDYHEAEALLGELEETEGKKIEYWIVRSELARRIGQKGLAIEHLEHASRLATASGDRGEAIRVARLLHDLDPDLPGLRARLESLIQKEEGAQRLRRIRRIAIAVGSVVFLVVAIPSLRYEVRARELLRQSLRFQGEDADAAELEKARVRLQQIVEEYGLATVSGRSRRTLESVEMRIEQQRRLERERFESVERLDREKREERRQEAERLLAEARGAEGSGRFEEARAVLDRLIEGPLRALPAERQGEVRLPLSIETSPPGATVKIAGVEVGRTPYVHHFNPSTETISIQLSRRGCADQQIEHRDDGRARLTVTLPRAPLAAGALLGGLDRTATAIPGHFLVPCRDGRVYALPDTQEATQVARRVFIGGLVGHPSARVAVSFDSFLIAGFDGQLICVGVADWSTRWTIRHDVPVLSAAALPDGHFAIGDERGRVIVLDRSSGREISRTPPSFPVEQLAVRGDLLLAIDRAHHCRTLELPRLALLEERILSSPIAAILPDGALLLADGTRCAFEGNEELPPPGTEVVERGGRVVYGSTDGRWVEFDGTRWNAVAAPSPLACAPLRHREAVFLGGVDGRVHCVDAAGGVHWTIELAAPAADLVPTSGGDVLALLRNGQIVLIEGKP